MIKPYRKPRTVAGTLFLDVRTPEEDWKRLIAAGGFEDVYIELPRLDVAAEVDFAHRVWHSVLQQFAMIDPVVVGPVDSAFMAEWQDRLGQLGLSTSPDGPRAYEVAARTAGATQTSAARTGRVSR